MEQDNLNTLTKELLDKLNLVREDYIRLKREQLVCIRKDLISVTLKQIISCSTNYNELKQNINNYIEELLGKEINNEE